MSDLYYLYPFINNYSSTGNSSVRRIFHQRNDDVFRLDIRYGNDRNQRPTAVPFEFLRFAQPIEAGKKS